MMLELEGQYKNRLNFIYYEDFTIEELIDSIQKISGDTCILLLNLQ